MPSGKYQQSASRANPACIIFLLDQSYSMNNGIAGSPRPKIDALATGINRFLADLITLCEKGEEKPRNYFDVGVIGYTTDRSDPPNPIIGSVLSGANGTLAGRDLVSVSDLFDDPLAIEDKQKMVDDGAGGLISTTFKLPVWYRKPADAQMSGTPMCAALEYVRNIVAPWCASHPGSFPPVVIHLTDGEPTDGEPQRLPMRSRGSRRTTASSCCSTATSRSLRQARWSSRTASKSCRMSWRNHCSGCRASCPRSCAASRSRRACWWASGRGAWSSTPTERRCCS